jgi:hypothetical protein
MVCSELLIALNPNFSDFRFAVTLRHLEKLRLGRAARI